MDVFWVLFLSPVKPGLSIIMSIPGALLRIGWNFWNEGMIGRMRSPNNFGLSFRVIRKNKPKFSLIGRCILDTERPYMPARGLLEPKPEPVDEVSDAGCFAYRLGGDIMSE